MLHLYAQQFNTVEINSSYYRIPPAAVSILQRKVPDILSSPVKANREMTHTRENNQAVFQNLRHPLQPLLDSGKLGCILAQFPYSFHYNRKNRDYLYYLKEKNE